ncbi:MAG: hypothetical protein M0038_05530 [Pseudomonadota bacterium]|nr:hypothetical protein [Pseudomonadota bacterium]
MKRLSPEVADAVKLVSSFLERAFDSGMPLGDGDAEILRGLGEMLLEVTAGNGTWVCARDDGGETPEKSDAGFSVAYHYHRARIEQGGAGDASAIEEVRTFVDPSLSDATIRKYSQRHRDRALALLESGETPADVSPLIEAHLRARGDKTLNRKLDLAALARELAGYIAQDGAPKVTAYREYLRKKSPRPDVE